MAKARKDEESNGKKSSIRFRYMDSERVCDFSVDNVIGESVTDGLRSIANALAGRTIAVNPAPKPLKKPGASTELLEEKGEETLETEALPLEETPDSPGQEEPENTGTTGTTAKPARQRKVKAPKLLAEPNLTTAKVSLEDFMKQKNPADMLDKYSVAAVWYKQQFNITDITIDRIFSAFKLLGWESQLPTDVEKPLKNLTYTKKTFDKLEAPGTYAINWSGEDSVNKMGVAKSASA
jgi:hypothetical protein